MRRYVPSLLASGTLLLGALAGFGGSAAAAHQPVVFTTIDENHGISPGSPINPYNPTGNSYDTYNSLQLAYFTYSPTNPDSFWPALAQKWKVSNGGTTVTVWLQPNARWSNGQPVTAQDVLASAALWFTQDDAQWYDLGSVKVLGPKEVQFSEVPGAHYLLFEHFLLQHPIVPASYWDKVIPKNIWTTIGQLESKNSKVAQQANNYLTNVLGKKLIADGPKQDISAGPFVIKRITPAEVLMVKNPYFFDANQIHVDEVVMRNYTGNQQIWNYQIAGQLDFTPYTSMPTSVLDRILATPGNVKVTAPSYVAAALSFNQNIYPYGNILVRWALAHVIDRQAVQQIGEPVSGSVSQYSDGMVDSATQQWLTPGQLKLLNPYRYNLAEATRLLDKAGFKLVNGQWMMPNGKPWTATIYDVSGFSDWIEAGNVIAKEMTAFGIPTQVQIVPTYSEYVQNMEDGKYAVGFWIMALGPNPYSAFNRIYGTSDGYQVVGGKVIHEAPNSSTGVNFLDTPETLKVPGDGFINPGNLTYQLSQTISPKRMQPWVAKLALATNRNLPMYTLWNYILVEFVDTSRFTHFPGNNNGLLQYGAGLWMMQGYVQPRH
jgi:peptide/nickel transport system substrate-binding protein